jgi:hypothetical protein
MCQHLQGTGVIVLKILGSDDGDREDLSIWNVRERMTTLIRDESPCIDQNERRYNLGGSMSDSLHYISLATRSLECPAWVSTSNQSG